MHIRLRTAANQKPVYKETTAEYGTLTVGITESEV